VAGPARVLTVCTGNVCRSPFMERALQAELDRSWGPDAVVVHSAGTGALAGHPMDQAASRELAREGYAADGFLARDLTAELVAGSDLVLTATRAHRGQVAQLHPRALKYVFTFREFSELVSGVEPGAVDASGDDAGEHVRAVVELARGQRGLRRPLTDEEADVVDPYRREAAVYDRMRTQIMAALPPVVTALGRP